MCFATADSLTSPWMASCCCCCRSSSPAEACCEQRSSVRWIRHLRVTTNYPSLQGTEDSFSASATPLDGDPLQLRALQEARRAMEVQQPNALACSFMPRAMLTSLLVAGPYAHRHGLRILVLPELAEEPCPRPRLERVYNCSVAAVERSAQVVACSLRQLNRLASTPENREMYMFLLQNYKTLLDLRCVEQLVASASGASLPYRPCRTKALANLFTYRPRRAQEGFRSCLFTHGNFMCNRVCKCVMPGNLAVYGHPLCWPAGHDRPDWTPAPARCYGSGMPHPPSWSLSPQEADFCHSWARERKNACDGKQGGGWGGAEASGASALVQAPYSGPVYQQPPQVLNKLRPVVGRHKPRGEL